MRSHDGGLCSEYLSKSFGLRSITWKTIMCAWVGCEFLWTVPVRVLNWKRRPQTFQSHSCRFSHGVWFWIQTFQDNFGLQTSHPNFWVLCDMLRRVARLGWLGGTPPPGCKEEMTDLDMIVQQARKPQKIIIWANCVLLHFCLSS